MKENVEKRLRDLADYLLLNAHALSSSGLMQGRAGIALSLFETAALLHDAYLEEQAFELLRQALLTRTEQIDMSSGLGGIGYALLHVVRGKLLDADFEELFGNQCRQIEEQMELKLHKAGYNGFELLDLALFWNAQERSMADLARNRLLAAAESRLEKWFDELVATETRKLLVKTAILSRWTHYLRVVAACVTYEPPVALFQRYMNLYRKDCFRNDWETGYWLGVLSGRVALSGLPEIASRNREVGNWDGVREEQLFSTYIRCSYLRLHDVACRRTTLERVRGDYLEASQEELETRLGKLDVLQPGMVGLHGIASLLLLLCAVCQLEDSAADNRIHFILGSL